MKEEVLELHRAKAEILWTLIKNNYPNENLFSLKIELLALLTPILEGLEQKLILKMLSLALEAEVEIGILSFQAGPEVSSSIFKPLGDNPQIPNI